MSISSSVRKAGPFAGNDIQTVFAFAFKVFTTADVLAASATAGVETTLTLGVDYTVALNPDQDAAPGGNLTLTAPLATGTTLAITSNVDALQAVTVTNGGGFFPAVFNGVFDKLTILIQQLTEKLGRSFKVPLTSTVTDLTLQVTADAVLKWNAAGTALESVLLPDLSLSLALPAQGGQAGKVLGTNGSVPSWVAFPSLSGYFTTIAGLAGPTATAAALKAALAITTADVGGSRLRLAADTTFYVNPAGSDANTGLTALSPWQTLQHAVAVIQANYDLAGYTATIQAADGTYTAGGHVIGLMTGQATPIVFQGNLATPANCIVSVTNGECFTSSLAADVRVKGFKVAATGTATGQGNGVAAYAATIRYTTMNFGACANAGVFASNQGLAINEGDYTVSGGGIAHLYANGGQITNGAALTVTVSGTPAFSTAFAFANFSSTIYAVGYTFAGGATGVRYVAQMSGVIGTGGGGASYFPGNSAGSTATGGQYA